MRLYRCFKRVTGILGHACVMWLKSDYITVLYRALEFMWDLFTKFSLSLSVSRPVFEPESSSPASHGLDERSVWRRHKHGGEVAAQLPLRTQKVRMPLFMRSVFIHKAHTDVITSDKSSVEFNNPSFTKCNISALLIYLKKATKK